VKTYGQWCSLAKALELVGERWTLLIVRELLEGPRRYSDLLEDVPGISTDVLAARLRDMEENGLVERRTLRPPASSKVYELTPLGEELRVPVTSLSRWGLQLLGPRDTEEFRPHWLATSLRGLVNRSAAEDVTLDIDFEVGADIGVIRIHVEDGSLEHVPEPTTDADVVVRADLGTLARLGSGGAAAREALASGAVEIGGSSAARKTYAELFRPAR
jgi:DNA-binding HxlR family transcriptional regulator/putative sterol carrier protein